MITRFEVFYPAEFRPGEIVVGRYSTMMSAHYAASFLCPWIKWQIREVMVGRK